MPYNLEDLGANLCYEMGRVHWDHTPQCSFINRKYSSIPFSLHWFYVLTFYRYKEYFLSAVESVAFPSYPLFPLISDSAFEAWIDERNNEPELSKFLL
jgi:hypothetical protein